MRQLLPIICLTFLCLSANAQCSLACIDTFVGELDTNCEYTANTADLLVAGCPGGIYIINVFDQNNNLIPGSPTIDGSYFGLNLSYTLTETNSGNSCFGNITLQDNIFPIVNCPAQAVVECLPELISVVPNVIDNCTSISVVNNVVGFTPYTCDADYVGTSTIFFEVTDAGGNSVSCFTSALVKRMDLSQVVFPPNYLVSGGTALACDGDISPTTTQFPSYLGVSLDQASYPDCSITISYTDEILPTIGCEVKTLRTWNIDELWCGSLLRTSGTQLIEQQDVVGPNIACIANFSISIDASGVATLDPAMINAFSSDNCSTQIDFTLSQSIFDCSHLGSNFVNLIATDECGNSNSCISAIEVQDLSAFCTPPAFLSVSGPLTVNQNFCASENLESDAQVVQPVSISFNAEQSILLMPGFDLMLGSNFSANIGPCND